jgi:hypothetical protein
MNNTGATLLSSFVEMPPTFVGSRRQKVAPLLIQNHHNADDKGIDFQYRIDAR